MTPPCKQVDTTIVYLRFWPKIVERTRGKVPSRNDGPYHKHLACKINIHSMENEVVILEPTSTLSGNTPNTKPCVPVLCHRFEFNLKAGESIVNTTIREGGWGKEEESRDGWLLRILYFFSYGSLAFF